MAKDTFYFSHDYNCRSDNKIKKLILRHGMEGYGIYWAIIEDLYNNANALPTDYELLAYELRVDQNIVERIINDFDLFVMEGGVFGSHSVERRLNDRNEKSNKARLSARKRWENKKTPDANAPQDDTNALPTQTDSNAIKERKGKESKVNKSKVTLMSEIEISNVQEMEIEYYNIAKSFFKLFRHNSENVLKTRWGHLDKLTYKKCVDPIRLLMTADKRTREELNSVYKLLQKDPFWIANIQSTEKMREKFDILITRTNTVDYGKGGGNNTGSKPRDYDTRKDF